MTTAQKVSIILILLGAITVLHYQTTIHAENYHDIYRRLYYVPIVLGGLWFRLRGGVLTALLASLIYFPHVLLQWGHHNALLLEQYLEILLYNIIGFLTGKLAHNEWQQKTRYQEAASNLEASYRTLREQTDMIIEFEHQMEKSARLSTLGELSAGLAHEIRNPLASIRLVADNLSGQSGLPEAEEYLEILKTEVERLNQVVEQYLTMARADRSEQQQVHLNNALTDIIQLVRQQASKQQVKLELEAEQIPLFRGAQVQLKQAFLNLALNALQAMPDGGTLIINCKQLDDGIQIDFSDNGHGLPEENLDQIFTPFYSTRKTGTGLGLAISRRIIVSHGGQIEAIRLPKGTCFRISLPLFTE